MNKNISLVVCLIAMVLTSCYRDEGNYDYTYREEIEQVSLESSYNVVSGETVLDLTAELTPVDEYDYVWFLKSPKKLDFDTLGHEKQLVWKTDIPRGEYTLYLKATARKDGYSRLFPIKIWSVSDYSDGWFVLKGIDGMTDLDFHAATEDKVIRNIFADLVGRRMPGTPGDLSLSFSVGYVPPEGETMYINMLWACSSEDAWFVNIEDMSLLRDWSSMFMDAVSDEVPLYNMIVGYQGMVLGSDKNAYFVNNQGSITGQFGLSADWGLDDMSLAGYAISLPMVGYYVYDQANQCFVALTTTGNPVSFDSERENGASMLVDVNHTGCDLCYMGVNKFDSDKFYAVMENAEGRYVYTLSIPEWLWAGPYWNPIENVIPVTGKKLNEATLFAIHSTRPYIYYNDASGEHIHYYDVLGNTEVLDVFSFPGEKVTFMKALYYDATAANESEKFDKFVVATEKDGNYKVYMYEMEDGRPSSAEPEILEGEGSVSSVMRIRKSMNQNMSRYLSGNYGVGLTGK